jgi:hypothetical protein
MYKIKKKKVKEIKEQEDIYHEGTWIIKKTTNASGKISFKLEHGFYSEYPIVYSKGKVGYDNPEIIPKKVKAKLRKLSY